MTRATLLADYLREVRGTPFRPGRHDCALFAAGWVVRAGGPDLARGWRSKYRSLARGEELLRAEGYDDHVALAAAHLPEVPPALAQTGDVAVVEDHAFGIVSADRVFVLRPDGLGHVSRMRAERAFRV